MHLKNTVKAILSVHKTEGFFIKHASLNTKSNFYNNYCKTNESICLIYRFYNG